MKTQTKKQSINKKPSLGIFSFSSCSGCQIAILNLEDAIVDLIEKFNVKYFHLVQERNTEGYVDVAILEGAITTKKQEEKLKEIRNNCGVLIALGSCACTGGIPAMKNYIKTDTKLHDCYGCKPSHINSINAQALDHFVKVDYYIRGCPITKEEFVDVVLSVLVGKHPNLLVAPVCDECRMNENGCLLDKGILCLGPISYAGCNSECPNQGYPCVACRGKIPDARLDSFKKLIKEKNFDLKLLNERFSLYLENIIK
jgi:sulfhydrogenase subunit delta